MEVRGFKGKVCCFYALCFLPGSWLTYLPDDHHAGIKKHH